MSQFVVPKESEIEYVIGIDFGHGETSAAICRVEDSRDSEDIDITGTGQYAIPSTIYIDTNGEIEETLIGNEAITKYGSGGTGDFYAYFKHSIETLDEKRDPSIRVMKLFMRKVYETICVRRAGELMEGNRIKANHVVFIACPSKSQNWSEQAMQNYVQLALEAGLPIAGASIDGKFSISGIVRESRAAYIRALQKGDVKQSVTEGILVIDYGSSTIDITYYKEGEKPVDKGYPVGASKVEQSILMYLKDIHTDLDGNQNPNAVREMEEKHPNVATRFLYGIRESKENFYTKFAFANELEFGFRFRPRMEADKIDVQISKETIEKILASYKLDVQMAFEDFKKNIIKDRQVTVMVLTGGASRMNFAQDLAKKVFGENIKILPPQSPSLTVSNGIATAGRADIRLYYIAQKVFSNTKIMAPDLSGEIARNASIGIAKNIIDLIHSCYKSFKDQSSDESVVFLREKIAQKMQEGDGIYKENVQIAFNCNIESHIKYVVDTQLKEYVKEQFPEFNFSKVAKQEVKNISVKISQSVLDVLDEVIRDSVKEIEDGVIAAVLKLLWNAVAAIAAGGLKIIGEIGGFIKERITGEEAHIKSYGEFCEMLMVEWNDANTKLEMSDRKKIYDAFNNAKSSYQERLRCSIEERIKNNEELKKMVNNDAIVVIDEYVSTELNNIQRLIK